MRRIRNRIADDLSCVFRFHLADLIAIGEVDLFREES
jgi:hypothetical protein